VIDEILPNVENKAWFFDYGNVSIISEIKHEKLRRYQLNGRRQLLTKGKVKWGYRSRF